MEAPDTARLLRWIRVVLPLALVLLIGGFAVSAMNASLAGYLLFGGAGISCGTGAVLLVVLGNRVRSHVREIQARQRDDLDRAFRAGPW